MIDALHACLAHAEMVPAQERADFGARATACLPAGSLLLQTCHRVEAYSVGERTCVASAAAAPSGTRCISGMDAATHVVRLAVGLESAVIGEDQILHQLRRTLGDARARGPVAPSLDRLVDISLRGGRRARTWLPPTSRGLAELALRRVADGHSDRSVLVVGAGEMGRRAVGALRRRGRPVIVASRTPERALALAADQGSSAAPFDPGPHLLRSVGGVVVALAGPWTLSEASLRALAEVEWVVDLSAPPAVDGATLRELDGRALTIDQLSAPGDAELSDRMRARLHKLVDDCLSEYARWSARQPQRELALALAERAHEVQATELDALWRRMPELDPEQRQEVERMARHLSERLLREPLEQLAGEGDGDGERARAVRELFRL